MLRLTDTEKVKVCALILAGESLPVEWQERLFPGSVKPPELCKAGTEAPAQAPSQKLLFTITEAAEKLSVSTKSISRLINNGRLRRVPHLGRVLIPVRELERFAKSLE